MNLGEPHDRAGKNGIDEMGSDHDPEWTRFLSFVPSQDPVRQRADERPDRNPPSLIASQKEVPESKTRRQSDSNEANVEPDLERQNCVPALANLGPELRGNSRERGFRSVRQGERKPYAAARRAAMPLAKVA